MNVQLPVYILAGGRGSRFGSDKARALLDGQPLIARIADALRPVAARVTVVADAAGKYADLGLHTIADSIAGAGPLGGLHAALLDLKPDEDWLLLASCDLVVVRAAWVERLWAQRGDAGAVAFKPDVWQPLLALYHRSLAKEVVARLGGTDRSLRGLLGAAGATAAALPADWPEVLQANTPAELARARRQPDGSEGPASA